MPLFSKSRKGPLELVHSLREAIVNFEKGNIQAQEELAKQLSLMKNIILESPEKDLRREDLLAQELYSSNLLLLFITNLSKINFESKKAVVQIFNNILRRQPTREYLSGKPEVLHALIRGYDNQAIAFNCGAMLRECLRYEALARIILYSDNLYDFFGYMDASTFDISSDAFFTFKELLTTHRQLSTEFLVSHYDKIQSHLRSLLKSGNYATRRQALQLLADLLNRYRVVMVRYISCPDNLKLIMNMLKTESKSIQYEAFHIFKMFVANTRMPRAIASILLRNRDKLVAFLRDFLQERGDERLDDEKAFLIKHITELGVQK